jgi:hypothetical protein
MTATPLRDRLEKAAPFAGPQPVNISVSATPYVWRNPTTIKPREWIYGRSIQRGHVRAIVAQGGAGKTILSVGEALAMVTGRDILGQRVVGGPKNVWLWNLEDDGDELARIIQAACKHWNISASDIAGRLFVDSALDGAILKLAQSGVSTGLQINRPLVEALTAELIARKIDYLHVDPFVSSHAVDESDNMEIDAVAKEWAAVAKNGNCGIGLAHHVSKAGAAEATALSARGAVALINACRSVLVLNRMSEEDAKRYGIEDEKRRRYFRVYDDKNNRAPPSDQSDWFRMLSVELGNGDFGGDNMGVVVPWSPPDAFDGVTADHLRKVQAAVAAGEWRSDHQAKAWVGYAIADVFGFEVAQEGGKPKFAKQADKARALRLISTWIDNGALIRVEGKDERRKPVTFIEVGEPAVDGAAPPSKGAAEQGGASRASGALHHHPHPVGGGVERSGAGDRKQVEQNRFVADNPALGLAREDDDPAVAAFDRGEGFPNG